MNYVHVDIEVSQSSKRDKQPCGDVVKYFRTPNCTTIIISDGMGSGIKANIAATMCIARLEELVKSGFTLRQAFSNLVKTMEEARNNELPYAVFTIARILSDGLVTVLTYEMPPVFTLSKHHSMVLENRSMMIEKGVVKESDFKIQPGDALVFLSDGIEQAGLGKGYIHGWGDEGIQRFIDDQLQNGAIYREIPELLRREAINKWKGRQEDDCTVVAAYFRPGKTINIFTGPPTNSDNDSKIVEEFFASPGLKIVCGATTAKIVARETGAELEMEENYTSNITPVNYYLDGTDLVTEGAVTLNQVYNVWDEDTSTLDKDNPVTDLYSLLSVVDRVNFFVGMAQNPANSDISFAQMGILNRSKIVKLLAEKLENDGKLVVIKYY